MNLEGLLYLFLFILQGFYCFFTSINPSPKMYCNQNTDIFILYIFTGASVFAEMPKFIGNLQNVTVPEGRDATFTCSVTNLGGHKVQIISIYI